MELRLFRYDTIVQVNLLSRNLKKPKKMAKSNKKWTGEWLGQSDDWANEDLRENNVEMTEHNLNWLEMTGNDIY